MTRTFWTTLLTSLLVAQLQGAEVRLVDQVAVQAPTITLGEIALIETNDITLRKQLQNLDLGKTPALGRNRVVTAFKIRSALSKAGLSHIDVHGLQTSVQTEQDVIPADELKAHIGEWVNQQIGHGKEAEVDFLSGMKGWAIPAGEERTIAIEEGRQDLAGPTTLTLTAMSNGEPLATRRVRVDISQRGETVVIVRPLQRGERVTADHVEVRESDLTNADGMEIAHLDDVIGLVAKRNLPVGALASAQAFDQPTLIERGSLNRILVVNGPIRMTIAGAEALQSGKKGQLLLFSNPVNGRETLRARVIREGLAVMKLR